MGDLTEYQMAQLCAAEAIAFWGAEDARIVVIKNMVGRRFSENGKQFWHKVWKCLDNIQL